MDFVIPLDKDDLLNPHNGQYYVRTLVPIRSISQALDGTRVTLEKEGPKFIFKHFDDFFSVIVHGNKLEYPLTLRAFDRIAKSVSFLARDLEGNQDNDREKTLSMLKMHVYVLSHLMCFLEDATAETESTGKKKKGSKKSDVREEWESRRDRALVTVYRLLQLPLQKYWHPPIVEESFVMLLAEICYKILEHDKEPRQTEGRQTLWQILGTLVKRYIHGITCTIKIIQLVKMYDSLTIPLAAGVVSMVTENNCPSFITEIAREIEQSNIEETEARNVASFLEAIATTQPDLILNILDNITDYLEDDSYIMRNCAIGILGTVVLGCLTGEDLSKDKKEQRDECFNYLETHMLDANAYVRSKVFQTWQKIGCEGALPLQRIGPLLKAVVLHLNEKSATMRKQSLQLLRVLLESNRFGATLDKQAFTAKRDEVQQKLQEVQTNVVAESASGDDERIAFWQEVAPQIQKAVKKMLEQDDDEDTEEENLEELNVDNKFELIRQQIVDRQFLDAVKCLKKVCIKWEYATDMAEMERDEKEYCFLMFILKIFLESEQNRKDDKEKFQSVAWKKRKEQIQALKRALNIMEQAVIFVTEMEQAIPVVETMLYAAGPAVAIEACSFLGTAFQFKIDGAASGIRKALSQVFSREESVKNNVAHVYKEIYLKGDQNNPSSRQRAIASVNSLIDLFKGLQPGQSPALMQLITIWFNSDDLDEENFQVMWEKFSFKISSTTSADSRSALALLTMVGHSQPKLITANVKTLIKIGLQNQGKEDLLLARDTCRALLKIRNDGEDSTKEPIRYMNDHEILEEIKSLVINHFEKSDSSEYVSFVTDALNVIYHLANQPDLIVKEILQTIMGDSVDNEVPESRLAKLLYVIGHVCIRQMVHLDTAVYKELKRRNVIRDESKGKTRDKNRGKESISSAHESARKARRSVHRNKNVSMQEEVYEDQLSGACADDADAEAIDEALENTIVTGNGFLTQFVPLVLDVCQHPEKYKNLQTQAWGVLALSKMMTVSSEFCNQHLQLLITILEKSTHPEVRSNVLVGLSDLMIRFPNEVEPWTAHIYGRLRDGEILVRKTAMRVLSNLVKREMIRVKGQMSEMALCIVDVDPQISNDAKQFFFELSQKGNVLYNILPDILSRLTSADTDVDEDDLHIILKHVLGLLHKEKETDALLDKICARFKLATNERQWRDLSYCLSLLQLGKKGIIRLTTNLPLLKDKIHNKQVYRALRDIIEAARKKPDAKDVCNYLEEAIEKLLDNPDDNADGEKDKDREAMPPPTAPPKRKPARRKKQVRNSSSEEEDEDNEDDDDADDNLRVPLTSKNVATPKARSNLRQNSKRKLSERKRSSSRNSTEDSDEENDITPMKRQANSRRSRKKSKDTSDDESEPSRRSTRRSAKSNK